MQTALRLSNQMERESIPGMILLPEGLYISDSPQLKEMLVAAMRESPELMAAVIEAAAEVKLQ